YKVHIKSDKFITCLNTVALTYMAGKAFAFHRNGFKTDVNQQFDPIGSFNSDGMVCREDLHYFSVNRGNNFSVGRFDAKAFTHHLFGKYRVWNIFQFNVFAVEWTFDFKRAVDR